MHIGQAVGIVGLLPMACIMNPVLKPTVDPAVGLRGLYLYVWGTGLVWVVGVWWVHRRLAVGMCLWVRMLLWVGMGMCLDMTVGRGLWVWVFHHSWVPRGRRRVLRWCLGWRRVLQRRWMTSICCQCKRLVFSGSRAAW